VGVVKERRGLHVKVAFYSWRKNSTSAPKREHQDLLNHEAAIKRVTLVSKSHDASQERSWRSDFGARIQLPTIVTQTAERKHQTQAPSM
jgi:hypothetical protein